MIWNILFKRDAIATFPRALNADTMFSFVAGVIDEQRDAKASRVIFDFENLEFIEPVGVVVLSNLIEYLGRCGATVSFRGHTKPTVALKFLDDSQFFSHYLRGQPVFDSSAVRPSTVPLQMIRKEQSQDFLVHRLMPWIGGIVGVAPEALASARASLEEILHNVADHSGVDFGCSFAQHFPTKRTIQIAISDFGRGIPDVVRGKVAGLTDASALRLACQEGFTTKSNVQNRGAGLPTLMRFTTRSGGNVLLVAGEASITASTLPNGRTKMTTKRARGCYPGTLVRVILQTDGLGRIAADAEPEPFEW